MGDLFTRMLERIAEKTQETGGKIILPNAQIPISNTAFKPILAKTPRRIAFVDGGNAEILKAPNFSLQFIRLYATIHEQNKRVKQFKKEFYALIAAQGKQGLKFEVETFNTSFALQHAFPADDETLRTGLHLATPAAIADVVRMFAEYALAKEICNGLNTRDLLVRDGDLMPTQTHAQQYLDSLKTAAQERGIVLCGLSKTTSILTDSGNSASAVLQRIAPTNTWLYQPENSNICFVKLHPRSAHVFRLDVINPEDAQNVANALASQANDPAFIGYPYGLIEADQFAQVQTHETARLKLEMRARGGTTLNQHLTALNAHDTLNRL